MIRVIIYIIGLVLLYISILHQKRKYSDIKLNDIFSIFGVSLLSWVGLIIMITLVMYENWDCVVLKRKENKKNETN